MNNEFIIIDGVSKEYPSLTDKPTRALKNTNLSLPDRGLIFVIGKSGSGKSSLLNIIGGIDAPSEGNIIVNGCRINHSDEYNLNSYRTDTVGFVFQDHNLIEDFNVRDNIKLPLISKGKVVDENRIDELLTFVGLKDQEHKKPSCLSGGQRQSIAIIRAIAKKPKLLLADEPTGSLDVNSAKNIFKLLKKLSETMPVLVVTHDARSAYEFADRIIELCDGVVIGDIIKNGDTDLNELNAEYEKRLKSIYTNTPYFTPYNTIQSAPSENKSSPLPFTGALRIALSQLKSRLIQTILFIVIFSISLMGSGLAYTVTAFNRDNALARTMSKDENSAVALIKGYIDEKGKNITYDNDSFTYDDYLKYSEDYGSVYKVLPCFYSFEPYLDTEKNDAVEEELPMPDGDVEINGLCELEEEIGEEELNEFFDSALIEGEYPRLNDDCIEILISDKLADNALVLGTVFDDKTVYPGSTYKALIGRCFSTENVNFKITGIYSCKYSDSNSAPSDDFKDKNAVFANEFVFPVALTNGGAISNKAIDAPLFYGSFKIFENDIEEYSEYSSAIVAFDTIEDALKIADDLSVSVIFADGYDEEYISDDKMLLSYNLYCEFFDKYEFDSDGNLINGFNNLVSSDLEELSIKVALNETEYKEYEIVGIFEDVEKIGGVAVVNNLVRTEIIHDSYGISSILISKDSADLNEIIERFNNQEIIILSPENNEMLFVDKLFSMIKEAMILITAVIIVFILILMYAIITKTISDNKKNIGILRTFGVSRRDLIKVYLINDVIYLLCSFVLGVGLYALSCTAVNYLMSKSIGMNLTLLFVNPIAILLMLVISIVAITLSSAIPIIKYTKMSPAEVIRTNV